MIGFLTANLASIVVGGLILTALVLAVTVIIRDKKRGKGSCGCGCSSCPGAGTCNKSD